MLEAMYMLILFVSGLVYVSGYTLGPPSAVCNSMIPSHSSISSQPLTESPYQILIDKTTVTTENNVTVALTGDVEFKGFMVQARKVVDESPVGIFFEDGQYKLMNCEGGSRSTMSHSNSHRKSTVMLTWQPEEQDEGRIYFRATFVKNYSTFWIGVKSEELVIEDRENNSTTDIIPQQQAEDLSSLCGSSFTCLGLGCNTPTNCNILSGYKKLDDGRFHIRLSGNTDGYIAIGFSEDKIMGDDAVVECVKEENQIKAYASYNVKGRKDNLRLEQQTGISGVNGSHVDGVLSCSFLLDPVQEIPGRTYNLTTDAVYLVVAAGGAQSGKIQYHIHGRRASETKKIL